MSYQPFSHASAYASQFLQHSFAPFQGQNQQHQQHQRQSAAPLFYSTLDNGSVAILDEEHGMLLPRSVLRTSDSRIQTGYSTRPGGNSQRGGRAIDEEDEEEEDDNDDGLGRYNSDNEEAAHEDIDPFRAPLLSTSASSKRSKPGWRMAPSSSSRSNNNNAYSLQVSQAALNDIYDDAQSVYSSVFVGPNNAKGKGKAVSDGGDDEEEGDHAHAAPPDMLLIDPTRRPNLTETPIGTSTLSGYPMPVSKYRSRPALGKGSTRPPDYDDWQDLGPRDPFWAKLYYINLGFALAVCIYTLLFVNSSTLSSAVTVSPPAAILATFPTLFLLTLLSSLVATCILSSLLVLKSVERMRPVLQIVLLLPPIITGISAGWAFSSSYASANPAITTLILRYTSIAIFLSVLFNIRWYYRSSSLRLERTLRVINVASEVLLAHPSIFLVTLTLLGGFLFATIPVLLVIAKLLSSSGHQESYLSQTAWVPSSLPTLLAVQTSFVYFWSLGVVRALLKHTISGTVGQWWFHRHTSVSASTLSRADPDPSASLTASRYTKYSKKRAARTVQDALARARGPSFGTVCLDGLVSSILHACDFLLRISSIALARSRQLTSSTSPFSGGIIGFLLRLAISLILVPLVSILTTLLRTVSGFAITHSAITGDSYSAAAKEAKDLISTRQGTDIVASHLIVHTILNLLSIAAGILGFIAGWLSVPYIASSDPSSEGGVVLEIKILTSFLIAGLCGIIPYWTVRFAGDVLSNTVDAVFVCFNIDLDTGLTNCQKAFEAFAYEEKEEEEDAEENDLAASVV